jgi:hypothetical protein
MQACTPLQWLAAGLQRSQYEPPGGCCLQLGFPLLVKCSMLCNVMQRYLKATSRSSTVLHEYPWGTAMRGSSASTCKTHNDSNTTNHSMRWH